MVVQSYSAAWDLTGSSDFNAPYLKTSQPYVSTLFSWAGSFVKYGGGERGMDYAYAKAVFATGWRKSENLTGQPWRGQFLKDAESVCPLHGLSLRRETVCCGFLSNRPSQNANFVGKNTDFGEELMFFRSAKLKEWLYQSWLQLKA